MDENGKTQLLNSGGVVKRTYFPLKTLYLILSYAVRFMQPPMTNTI